MVRASPPDTSSRFPISASWSETASFAETASYALNGGGGGSSSFYAVSASYAQTASYGVFEQLIVTGSNGSVGYVYVARRDSTNIGTYVDSFTSSFGNTAEWIVSVNDTYSSKTSKIISSWNTTAGSVDWSEITTNAVGNSPYAFSVTLISDQIGLYFNPASGSWTIKVIRFMV